MRLLTFGLSLILPIVLGGCYTVRGVGQDLSAAGRALSNAADTVMGEPEPAAATPPPATAQGSSGPPRSLAAPPPPAPEQPK
ncbi:MAG TPA: entericidin A/B family lipoprotein [Stellaceae bacterium]